MDCSLSAFRLDCRAQRVSFDYKSHIGVSLFLLCKAYSYGMSARRSDYTNVFPISMLVVRKQ